MAIFYNHIKGCGSNSTGVVSTLNSTTPDGSTATESWAWITWASTLKYVKHKDTTDGKADVRYRDNCPELKINNANIKPEDTSERLSLGKFIVSDARYQNINFPFTFTDNLSINKITTANQLVMRKDADADNPIVLDTTISDTSINMNLYNTSQLRLYWNTEAAVTGTPPEEQPKKYARLSYRYIEKTDDNDLDKNYEYLDINSGNSGAPILLTSTGVVLRKGGLYARDLSAAGQTDVQQGVIKADKKCEALYFNATSDRRAKSNIKPAEFSALDIIKQLPVYTFNYLNDPKSSVGLIAQEAAEHDLDGFNMVDNLDASGEFGDFMQMKESKLVYVLWKAVQELSAEVETLKAEIRNLK